MTKREEFCNWFRKRFGFRESAANEVADKVEEIWGISGNNQVIPSNLPSKEEFAGYFESKYIKTVTIYDALGNLYDWLVSQLGQSVTNDQEEPAYKKEAFNLETALAHPEWVYTKDGRKARIVCTDRNFPLPILALVANEEDDAEFPWSYGEDGIGRHKNTSDLILRKPVKRVKKQGWVNVYDDTPGNILECWADGVFQTKEEALNHMLVGKKCPKQVKIEWTEEE